MGKIFNVSADCQPELHYMVAISNRIFETVFYNFFLTSAEVQSSDIQGGVGIC